ncbi:chromosome segregation and condensation protein ScpB [Mesorhizobium shonense]|uniref:Chromosome segregation and condensation protein ScpB n=1 Tax=Mesorhizobium shonense TaxID=1209948 RepID=A0ABV2HYL8_9HYPH
MLMCIAYVQPITRGELSSFFGKEVSRDLIGVLRAQDFIASGPRSPQPGAHTYVTTKNFLSQFGLDTLRQLPDFEARGRRPVLQGEVARRGHHAGICRCWL